MAASLTLSGPRAIVNYSVSWAEYLATVMHPPGIEMNKAELDTYRKNLLALRDRHNGDVSHLADEALRRTGSGATGNLSNMPIHMADLGTDNYEQEFTLSLMQNEEQLLGEITAA